MILSEALEELRDAHRTALDWGLWGVDAAEVLTGPGGARTRDAMARFDSLYNRLYRQIMELENGTSQA